MFTLHYICYHLPEQCICESHKKEIFNAEERTLECESYGQALHELIKWNNQLKCWQYVPIKIEQTF